MGQLNVDKGRREFMRKSAYAACATPVITAMLVNKASACVSFGHGGHGDGNLIDWLNGNGLPTQRDD